MNFSDHDCKTESKIVEDIWYTVFKWFSCSSVSDSAVVNLSARQLQKSYIQLMLKSRDYWRIKSSLHIQYLFNNINEIQLFFEYLNEFLKFFESLKYFERDFEFNLFNLLILDCIKFRIDFNNHFNYFNIVNWNRLLSKIYRIKIIIVSNIFDRR